MTMHKKLYYMMIIVYDTCSTSNCLVQNQSVIHSYVQVQTIKPHYNQTYSSGACNNYAFMPKSIVASYMRVTRHYEYCENS